jgi:uncharacterized Zn finger protein (UPF0148 family)
LVEDVLGMNGRYCPRCQSIAIIFNRFGKMICETCGWQEATTNNWGTMRKARLKKLKARLPEGQMDLGGFL